MNPTLTLILFLQILILNVVNSVVNSLDIMNENENYLDIIYKPLDENVGQFISYKDGTYHYETVDSVKQRFIEKIEK